jgi:hypothetical protein
LPSADLTLELLADRAAIYDLLVRYACGVDERDFDAVAKCFAPNVKVNGWAEQSLNSRDDLIEFIRGVEFFDWSMHLFHRTAIAVDGDEATASTGAMLAHRQDRPGKEPMLYNVSDAVYADRLARRGGRWLIVERTAVPTWDEMGTDDACRAWLVANAPGDPLLDRELLTDALASAHPDHVLGNRRFTIDGDHATVDAYAITPDDGTPWWERTRTLTSEFQRADGAWSLVT